MENYVAGPCPEDREASYAYRLQLAKGMKADVLELFRLGNKLTVENGYPSYIDLVLAVEELDRARLLHLHNDFLDCNLSRAKELILKYGLTFTDWFSDLNKMPWRTDVMLRVDY